ncbi:hypothetical protein GF319_15610 [Candidatus Bathyarchaeota archaeon]|nr:hypothetical protein [Candidatus Bathyarchaeota archaeon]
MSEERTPSVIDYLAGAVLSYGIVYFWIQILNWIDLQIIALISYFIYFSGALSSAYLVLRRANTTHLRIGITSALASWAFTVFSLLALTEGANSGFFIALLICFVLGGVAASYISLKNQLRG